MTDQALLHEMQIALLEPPDYGQAWPSEVWTRAEAIDAVNAAIGHLVLRTQLVITYTTIAVTGGDESIPLPDDWMATVHSVWVDTATSVRTPLGPVDGFSADAAIPGWEDTDGTPIGYLDRDRETLTIRLAPTPALDGTLELFYVARPTTVNGNNVTIPVPELFLSGVKYGALSYLLSKVGRLQDPERVAYCDERVQLTDIVSGIILQGWS
jgi:hypothetical protein